MVFVCKEIQEFFEAYPQVLENQIAYNAIKEDLENEHFGEVVLMYEGNVVAFYNDMGDAYRIACDQFGLGNFLIKRVGDQPISLGIQAIYINSNDTA